MTGGDPNFLPKQLGAVVDEYFDYVKSLRSSRIEAIVDYYKPRLDVATGALQNARQEQIAYLGSHPGTGTGTTDPQYNAIAAEVATAQNQYDDAQKNYSQAEQALTIEQAQASSHVIDLPAAAIASSKKKAAVFAGAGGLFFGLLVGLLGLIALTAADTAARRREDIETKAGDLQVVATIAEFPRERERSREAGAR
jgi:hypothetical protein